MALTFYILGLGVQTENNNANLETSGLWLLIVCAVQMSVHTIQMEPTLSVGE